VAYGQPGSLKTCILPPWSAVYRFRRGYAPHVCTGMTRNHHHPDGLQNLIQGFSGKPGRKRQDDDSTVEGLYAKIGRLEIENDFLKKVLSGS
jgi:hypothetical protein